MTLRASTTQPISLSVATQTALRAADASYLVEGDIAYVRAENLYYQYEPDSTATVSATVLVTANSNAGALAGRWTLVAGMGGFTTQANWFIDAVAGNDENDGATALTALATWGEFARRVSTYNRNTTVTLLTALAEPLIGTFRGIPDLLNAVTTPTLTIIGTPTANVTSTITATAAPSTAGNTEGTLTSPAVADWTAHVGRIVETTNGAVPQSWTVVLANVAGTAQIPFWAKAGTGLTLPAGGVAIRVLTPSAVELVNLTSAGNTNFLLRYLDIVGAEVGSADTQFEACRFTVDPINQQDGRQLATFIGCSIQAALNPVLATITGGAFLTVAQSWNNGAFVSISGAISYVAVSVGGVSWSSLSVVGGAGVGGGGGFGIFNVAGTGLTVSSGGRVDVGAGVENLYGDGNTAFGLNVIDGGIVFVHGAGTLPNLVDGGVGQDIALDGQATVVLPLTAADLAVPAAEALATWANWNGDGGANWRRVAVNYAFTAAATGQASGARIVGDRP